jgi:pinoresinol/lariciresinol reductase
MGNALEPGRVSFDEKMELRRAIEDANIPHTYISANCFAAYFCPNLCQMATLLPPKEKVHVYGDGNVKGNQLLSVISCLSINRLSYFGI